MVTNFRQFIRLMFVLFTAVPPVGLELMSANSLCSASTLVQALRGRMAMVHTQATWFTATPSVCGTVGTQKGAPPLIYFWSLLFHTFLPGKKHQSSGINIVFREMKRLHMMIIIHSQFQSFGGPCFILVKASEIPVSYWLK